MTGRYLWLAFLLCLLSTSLLAQKCVEGKGKYLVLEVQIKKKSDVELSAAGLARGKIVGRCFDDKKEIQERAAEAYRRFGFFKVQILRAELTVLDEKQKPQPVAIQIKVDPGLKFRTGEVRWKGAKKITPQELSLYQAIHSGDIFDTEKVRDTLEALRPLYLLRGKCLMSPVPDTVISGDRVDLVIEVDEGPDCKTSSETTP